MTNDDGSSGEGSLRKKRNKADASVHNLTPSSWIATGIKNNNRTSIRDRRRRDQTGTPREGANTNRHGDKGLNEMKWTLEPFFIAGAIIALIASILTHHALAAVMIASTLCFWAISKVMR